MIIIDASGATSGIDFEAFIRGGFVADQNGGGQPKWDNSNAFTGEELFFSYGAEAASKYVFAHGEGITYDGPYGPGVTHTIYGTAHVLEFGTRGSGAFNPNGYFTGGNVEVSISGLDLSNAKGDHAGPLNNFAAAYMGMGGEAAFDVYADALDSVAQHFKGSAFDDVFAGTEFADILKGKGGDDALDGGAGEDLLRGGLGQDLLTGGGDADTFIFAVAKHSPAKSGEGRDTIVDFSASEGDLIDLSALRGKIDFIGSDGFSGDREVRYVVKNDSKTVVSVDKNGDGSADLKFKIASAVELTEGDFIL